MRASRWVLLGVILVALVLLGGGIWWYVAVPHTPEAQFAKAEKLEKDLRAQAVTRKLPELQPLVEDTIEQYRRVGSRFGKNPKVPEALKKIAGIQEQIEKQNKKALTTLEQLARDYPEEDNAGYSLFEQARLIQADAKEMKNAGKDEDARKRLDEALAKLDEFMKKFDKSPRLPEALMAQGRIWMDDIVDPPIHAIDIFTKIVKEYAHSAWEPEALFRLGQMFERIKEDDKALAVYTQLIEQYPKSKEATEATGRRGDILARMDKHDEAAKDLEQFAQNLPADDPRGQAAGQQAKSEEAKAAEDQGKKYGESRYGGSVPFDTSADKALPPAEMLKQYIEQKLDAETYDLNVTFAPAEHRITVDGTLKLTNKGADKKDLLLMLGPGLTLTKLAVDGAAAESKHVNDALKITLPAVLKKDAGATLAFTYSGQYADGATMKNLKPGPGGGMKGAKPGAPAGPEDLKGKPAPEVKLQTLDGKEVSFSQQRGKVILLDMWATWCPPCRESLPHLEKMSTDASLAAKGLVVWAADQSEEKSTVEPFLKEKKFTFPVLMDEKGELSKAYKVTGIPTTVVIGRDGVVRDVFVGYGGEASGKEIEAAVEKALAEPAPAPGATPAPAPATAPAPDAAKSDANLTFDPQLGLGEFGYGLSGASWYPITIIGDVFDAHVVLNTPANMEAVSNGEFVKREKSNRPGTPGRFEFQTRNPVFGLYFAYGDYVVKEKQVGPIHFYTYLRAPNAAKSDAYIEVANNILSFYASKFNGFPFEKMAVIETPLPPFLGGVGPASLMFLQEDMVAHPEVPENLLAHELAHQWFGNLIPINLTDPGYNQWLSEGFATYCDALYTQHKDGPKAFDVHIQQYQQLYFQFQMHAPASAGAIRNTMSPMSAGYRPVVYEKGALVLHMLRRVMGDQKFFALLSNYVATYKNRPSTVDDFRRMASEAQGADLSWFFAEWYDQNIFAHYKLNAAIHPEGAGAASTKLTINQPDSLIKMPVDVTFIGAGGERQVEKDVMVDIKEKNIEIRTPFVPVKIIVDEENWVLKRLGTDNIWTSSPAAVSPGLAPATAVPATQK
jgi:TolA-binding protein/peroxiredoxin